MPILKPKNADADRQLDEAVKHLKAARDLLKAAGCDKTLKRVRLALTSAGGAQRHIWRRPIREGKTQ